jgi:hypothetical protein
MKHFLIVIQILVYCITVTAKDIFVSPGGNDTADGSSVFPLQSIETARKLARQFVAKEAVIIYLSDGVYYLDKTIAFKPEDGGTKEFPIYYKAVNEGKAIVSGGKLLNVSWTPAEDGMYVCDIPKGLEIDQLFINNKREEMARFPNSKPGYNVFDCWTLSHSAKADPANDPLSKEKVAQWKNPEGAYLHAMHNALWGDMHWKVLGKKSKSKLELEGGWQNNRPSKMHPKYRFIEHVFEELDASGEWYYNKATSRLYYYPRPGVDLESARVEIVSLRHLIEFNGSKEDPVQHIHLQGLTFKHSARVFMDNKEPLLRSDWTVYRGGAVTYNGAENCSVINCEFDQLGGNSVFVNNYNRHINITGCYIHHSGANGIAFVGDPNAVRNPIFRYGPQDYTKMDLTPGPIGDNYPANCIVSDCIITKTGRDEKQTSPVQISMSFRITVSHCSIYDVPRAGINISEGTFGGHIIEYCDVFNTVLETGDHGSFNSWGRDRFWDPSTQKVNDAVAKNPDLPSLDMLESNIIRNSRWRCDHGWDIDLDDGSSNYHIYNNLLLNGGLKLREGYNRVATNNIIVNNGFHPHVWFHESGDVFKHNIVFKAHQPAVMTRGLDINEKWGEEIDYNIYTSSNHDRLKFAPNQCDLNSIVADPEFNDPTHGDFTVSLESKALKMGFTNFDMFSFGVVSPRLKAIAKTPEMPEVKIHPDTTYVEPVTKDAPLWNGARIHEPKGDELSAYGVKFGTNGVALVYVPRYTLAWNMGFRTGDFVVSINNKKVKDFKSFEKLVDEFKGDKNTNFSIRRNQVVKELNIEL